MSYLSNFYVVFDHLKKVCYENGMAKNVFAFIVTLQYTVILAKKSGLFTILIGIITKMANFIIVYIT